MPNQLLTIEEFREVLRQMAKRMKFPTSKQASKAKPTKPLAEPIQTPLQEARKLRSLELAIQSSRGDSTPQAVVNRAMHYETFLKGPTRRDSR